MCTCVCGRVPVEPVMAEGLNISHRNSTHATLEWRAPNAAPNALYLVKYSGSFWDHHGEPPVTRGQTSVTVGGLRPGTRYKFQVITVSGLQESDPASLSHFTCESAGKACTRTRRV